MLRETGKRSMLALLGFLEQHYFRDAADSVAIRD